MRNYPIILFLLFPVQFKQCSWVELPQTPVKIILQLFFLELLSSSSSSHEIFSILWSFSLHYSVVQAVRQGWTIHRTHEMFSYDPCSLNYSVVWAVHLGGTTLNSWTTVQWSFFPQLLGSSTSSKGVNYTLNSWNVLLWSLYTQILGSLSCSAEWKNPELMTYCRMIFLSSVTP